MSGAEVDDVDEALAHSFDPHQLAREGWVPVRIERDEYGFNRVVVAVAGRPSAKVAETVRAATGIPEVEQVVTTDWDVRRALGTTWRGAFVAEAVSGLAVPARRLRLPEAGSTTCRMPTLTYIQSRYIYIRL